MVNKMLMKQVWFPRPHNMTIRFAHGLETGVANTSTIIPILMNDEGLGNPADYEAHPENASFVEAAEPNCYPESRINNVIVELIYSLTKGALVTDGLEAVRGAFMTIFPSFDDIIANDELSGLDIGEILELQRESTDRQCYPLWNGVDMPEAVANLGLLATNVPGLTTNQLIEGVAFSHGDYYNCLQYLTNGNKLKNCQGGLKWFTLTKTNPVKRFKIHIRAKSKRINPYTFMGVLSTFPPVTNIQQYPVAADTTNINHVNVYCRIRYNEWNPEFNMRRV